jgi:hypothetical protein
MNDHRDFDGSEKQTEHTFNLIFTYQTVSMSVCRELSEDPCMLLKLTLVEIRSRTRLKIITVNTRLIMSDPLSKGTLKLPINMT